MNSGRITEYYYSGLFQRSLLPETVNKITQTLH
jgi:hypothetical protein